MRNGLLAGLFALALGVAACGGERPTVEQTEGPQPGSITPTTVTDVPPAAASFLEEAGPEGTFAARFHVLRKLGSVETDIEVAQSPPWSKVEAGDVVVISGPDDYTCLVSAAKCVAELQEQQLSPFGVFSAFFSTGPIRAVETMARVEGATFERSSRTAAGLELDCLSVLVGGATSGEWCMTPDGVFAYVDTADVRIELRDYQEEAEPDFDPPGAVVDDDGFLRTASGAAPSTPPFTAVESADNRCDYMRCSGRG